MIKINDKINMKEIWNNVNKSPSIAYQSNKQRDFSIKDH